VRVVPQLKATSRKQNPCTQKLALCLSHCLSHTAPLTVSLSLCHSHCLSLTATLSLCLSLSPSLCFSLSLSLSLSHCLSHCASHCLSHCVSHCLSHGASQVRAGVVGGVARGGAVAVGVAVWVARKSINTCPHPYETPTTMETNPALWRCPKAAAGLRAIWSSALRRCTNKFTYERHLFFEPRQA
jgi:hypothetical protein